MRVTLTDIPVRNEIICYKIQLLMYQVLPYNELHKVGRREGGGAEKVNDW